MQLIVQKHYDWSELQFKSKQAPTDFNMNWIRQYSSDRFYAYFHLIAEMKCQAKNMKDTAAEQEEKFPNCFREKTL